MSEKQEQTTKETGFMNQIGQEADESLHPLLQKVVDNIKVIALVLFLIIGGVGGYAWYTNKQKVELEAAYAKLGQIVMLSDHDKKIEELNTLLQTAPANLKPAIRLELITVYQTQNNHEKSLEQWEKLTASTDPTTKTLALLGQANNLIQLKKFDQALQTLQQAKDSSEKHYMTIITGQLGIVAELAEKWEAALSAYEELKVDVHITNKDFIDYKINKIKKQMKS